MHRLSASAPALLLLAACAAGGPPAPAFPDAAVTDYGVAAPAGPSVDWITAYRHDAVEVRIMDPRSHYRVQQVRLIGPDGRSYEASDLTRNVVRDRTDDWYGRPALGVGGAFGSHGGGLGIGLSFPIGVHGGDTEPVSRITTEARIPVPDPALYRETAPSWTVEVTLLDPSGDPHLARIPAPVPQG